jgi:hypothetical protein
LVPTLLVLVLAEIALAEKHAPSYRIDPLRAPVPNGTTLLLWRFEEGKATDSTIAGNHGEVRGAAERTDGRFGKALRLKGGSLLLKTEPATHHLIPAAEGTVFMVDFWCRPESYPTAGSACLLDMPRGLRLRLELTTAGRLHLSGEDIAETSSADPLPLGEWSHVAVFPTTFIQPNEIYADRQVVQVRINGFSAILARTPIHRGIVSELHPVFVGANTRGDDGFTGAIDELRISRGAVGVYEMVHQEFANDPGHPLLRSPEHFRQTNAQIWAATFDSPDALKQVMPPEKFSFIDVTPPVVHVGAGETLGNQAGAETGGDMADTVEDEIAQEQAQEKMPPLAPVDGVRGKAMAVRGGMARIPLNGMPHLDEMTLEFWFKPGNWDNLAQSSDQYGNAHIVTMWGVPKNADGEAVPLVSFSARRAQGREPVAPEFEKFFAEPKLPLVPHKWVHVQITRDKHFSYLNGCFLDGSHGAKATIAANEVWDSHRAAYLTFGNGFETSYDEFRLHSCVFDGVERSNARAIYTTAALRPLTEATYGRAVMSLGEMQVNAEVMPDIGRFGGGWLTGWVSGTVTRGPLEAFFGYRLTIGKLIVALVLKEPASAASADVDFSMPHEKSSRHGKVTGFKEGRGGVVLDVGLLPEGHYPVKGALRNAAGEVVTEFDSVFYRIPFPWLNNTLGLPETPPEPFTPVTVQGQRVSVVGREYAAASDGGFSSISVNGENILAAPLQLEVQCGDKTQVFQGTAPPRFGQCVPTQATWETASEAAGIVARSSVTMEYDGTAMRTLDVAPAGPPVTLDRLSLRIPLKKEYGEYIHVLPHEGGFRDYVTAGLLPPSDGLLWDSKKWKETMPVHVGVKGNMASMVWLGGTLRGLVWFADNDKGWLPNDERASTTITRQNGVVSLDVYFINEHFTLDTPRRITYGVLATPPKPLPKDHRLWNRSDPAKTGPFGMRLTSCDAFAPWKVPPVGACFDYWPRGDDWDFARLAMSEQRNLWSTETPHGKYPKGIGLLLYHDANRCPVHPDMAPYFTWEWRWRSYPKTRIDNLVWYMDKWIANGLDGTYIDDVFPGCDWNLEPVGTAYLLPDGRKQIGASHMLYREYLKRFYALFQQYGKPSIITTHMTDTLSWPEHCFASSIYDGEHGARGHGSNKTYIDAWPLDYLLTIRNPERSGLITVSFGLQTPQNWDKTAPELWKYCAKRSFQAVILLFDHSNPIGGVATYYAGTDVEVYPFWRNSHVVQVEPVFSEPVTDRDLPVAKWWTRLSDHLYRSLAQQPFRATLYKKANRCMVVVVNLLRRSVAAKVSLSFEQLGIAPEHRAGLSAVDIDDWLPPPGTDMVKLHVADVPCSRSAALLSEIQAKGGFPDAPASADSRQGDEPAHMESMLTRPEGADGRWPEPEAGSAPAEADPFFAVGLNGNILTLNVAGHNFRAIELRWGPNNE